MREALLQAKKAKSIGEVPVGAVIVKEGKIISKAYNTREKTQNALHHAEILAIEKACKKLKTFRLNDCSIYVTLEPCPMCSGAIVNARLGQVFIGCKDKDFGCCGGKINLANGDFGYSPQVTFGIMEKECKELIDNFFDVVREKNKLKKYLGKLIEVNQIENKAYFSIEKNKIECVLDKNEGINKTSNTNKFVEKKDYIKDEKLSTKICNYNKNDIGFYNNQNRENAVKTCQKKIFAIIDELRSGRIIFLCDKFDKKDLPNIVESVKLKGRIKIFEIDKEPIIIDIKKNNIGEK